jgi:hypothetical protein
MARWQYQQRTEPLVEIVTSDKWAPLCPSRIIVRTLCLTTAILAGSCFLDANPIVTIDQWQGQYPSRLDRIKRIQPIDFTVFAPAPVITNELVTLDKWQPTHPNRLDRNKRIQSIDFTVDSYDYPTLDKWIASYPNRLDRIRRIYFSEWFGTKLYWYVGPEILTMDKWTPNYPNRLDRAKRVLWLDWGMIDSCFSHIPVSSIMLYLRRYLDDPLG